MQRNYQICTSTPTIAELKEEGTWNEARDELMRNDGYESMNYLEELAEDAGFDLVKKKKEKYEHTVKHECNETCKFGIPFDIEEMEHTNCLIVGANRTGKTRLACAIASVVKTFNWRVLVFDNSGKWKEVSDMQSCYMVTESNFDREYVFPEESCIFDMSLLKPNQQQQFVDKALEILWNTQVKDCKQKVLVILEEGQLYMRNIRWESSQNLMRIASVGRNWGIRVLTIVCDLALLDPAYTRLAAQRYYGRLYSESNSKRRFRSYHGGDWLKIVLELDVGCFIYMNKNSLKIVKIPLFKPKRQIVVSRQVVNA